MNETRNQQKSFCLTNLKKTSEFFLPNQLWVSGKQKEHVNWALGSDFLSSQSCCVVGLSSSVTPTAYFRGQRRLVWTSFKILKLVFVQAVKWILRAPILLSGLAAYFRISLPSYSNKKGFRKWCEKNLRVLSNHRPSGVEIEQRQLHQVIPATEGRQLSSYRLTHCGSFIPG